MMNDLAWRRIAWRLSITAAGLVALAFLVGLLLGLVIGR